ncbi:uncharacterized protein LOC120512117 [Passer montanus]|uniref:uncharacterized protein LOC120512117 n=1 Tax=Passer montanus TaxID=9160 RepID=UPI001961664B|nr:uncharacterized protein LOC120512117 [Passer montanus]
MDIHRRWGVLGAQYRNFFTVRYLGFLHTRLYCRTPSGQGSSNKWKEIVSLLLSAPFAPLMLKLQRDRQAAIVPSGSRCLAAIPRGKTQEEKGNSRRRKAPHLAARSSRGRAVPSRGRAPPAPKLSRKLIFGLGGPSPPACLSPACPLPVSCLCPACLLPPLRPPRRAAHSPAARSGRSVAHASPAGAVLLLFLSSSARNAQLLPSPPPQVPTGMKLSQRIVEFKTR